MKFRDSLQHTHPQIAVAETATYLESGSKQIYCVLHSAQGERRGGVLLVPPFGRERLSSYVSLVSWARRLAASGFDVVRFDYSGTGESSGKFENADLLQWREDTELAAGFLRDRLEGQMLFLHGVRFGALLASTSFSSGTGDAMLLWEPPKAARKMLLEVLRRKLLEDMALGISKERKTRDAYVRDLEAGHLVEVDGHSWSRQLWESSEDVTLQLPEDHKLRPWLHVNCVSNAAMRSTDGETMWKIPVPTPSFWNESRVLVPNLSALFDACLSWLNEKTEPGDGR